MYNTLIFDPSKIISFEKNPDKNGNPHKQSKQTITLLDKIGVNFKNLPKFRKSCPLSILWIITPEIINKEALKRAWHNKWKKQKINSPKLKEKTINPNWLKVENAIVFFISHS